MTSLTIVRVTEAVFVGLATLAASTCTVIGDGKIRGAVNSPPDEMVPSEASPPITPFTDHSTAVFVVFETVAVRVVVSPSRTVLLAALTLTLIGGPPGVPDGLAPTMPPHPLTATAATPTAKSSHALHDQLRANGWNATDTLAFESKANASHCKSLRQRCERASRQRLLFRNEYNSTASWHLENSQ